MVVTTALLPQSFFPESLASAVFYAFRSELMSKEITLQGSCLCGAVTYQASGPFNMMIHCHCSMCRKHHGSAFATFVGAPLMGFKWLSGEDNILAYASS